MNEVQRSLETGKRWIQRPKTMISAEGKDGDELKFDCSAVDGTCLEVEVGGKRQKMNLEKETSEFYKCDGDETKFDCSAASNIDGMCVEVEAS